MNVDLIKFYRGKMEDSVAYLSSKRRILFLTTSNRWSGEKGGEMPKSTQLAYAMKEKIGEDKVDLIDVTKLNIYPCEGNVSTERGNTCGLLESKLQDPSKNPSGNHRCWASLNNPDDELWKISKALLAAEAVVVFGSVRWGQMNSFYQKLTERLTWLENRHSTLGESNLLAEIDAGLILVNQNWKGEEVLATQKDVMGFYGFQTPEVLFWNWQFSNDASDERDELYREAAACFRETFLSE
jgi:multimeric flavodoxin WrbA